VPAGRYAVAVGASSEDLKLTAAADIVAATIKP
jgi:hypothetical protein